MATPLKDYKGIKYRDWKVEGARAVVVLIHGMGATSRRWQYFSVRLNEARMSGYALELPGFGDLAGEHKGHVDSMQIYHDQIRKLKELAVSENPGKSVFIMGESMGGLLATSHALRHDPDYKGLVAIVPAFTDVMKFSAMDRVRILMISIFDRKQAIKMPFFDNDLTSDAEILGKLRADDKEHKFASAGLLREMLFEGLGTAAAIGGLKVPVLMLLSGKDRLVSTPYSIKVFNKIKSAKNMLLYQNSLHALTIEKNREEVFRDIIEWMKGRL